MRGAGSGAVAPLRLGTGARRRRCWSGSGAEAAVRRSGGRRAQSERVGAKEQIDALKLRKAEAKAALEGCTLLAQNSAGVPDAREDSPSCRGASAAATEGEIPLHKAYSCAFVDLIVVEDDQIIIQGRKDVLVRMAAKAKVSPAGAVLTFALKWRARQDSNL